MELTIKHFNELTNSELYDIMKLRVDVFVVEQNCPYYEFDGIDKDCWHLWLGENGKIQAYLRVIYKGKDKPVVLGRVISVKRRCGLGTRILEEAIEFSKEKFGAKSFFLEAQTYAKGLYEKVGFRQCSGVFPIDGIPHIEMELNLGSIAEKHL